jgi:glucose-1-phosphate cytidylyltransferase
LKSDIDDWNITFVDTGLHSNVGQRLRAVRKFVENEPMFLANYSDGLTDLHLPTMIEYCTARDKCASFASVKPSLSFHVVTTREDSLVTSICSAVQSDIWINGGYFVFKRDIFNYIYEEEELVEQPFNRLIQEEQLLGYRYEGFWSALDTFKDKQRLDDLYGKGGAPWEVWKKTSPDRHEPSLQPSAVGSIFQE